MKSITLHNIDDLTAALIDRKSKEWGLSLNKTIQRLLRESLGVRMDEQERKETLKQFFGKWTQAEFEEFNRNVADLNKVDPEDWE